MDPILQPLISALRLQPPRAVTSSTTGKPIIQGFDSQGQDIGAAGENNIADIASMLAGTGAGMAVPSMNFWGRGGNMAPLAPGFAKGNTAMPNFLDEGGGNGISLGSPSGFANAPAATVNSPTTLGGMVSSAFGGPASGKGVTASNVALGILGALVGVPAAAFTAVPALLGLATQVALKFGLTGQDTSGLVDQPTAEANGFTSPSAMSTIAQGLGLSAGQLAAINANATFGRGSNDPDDAGAIGPTGNAAPGAGNETGVDGSEGGPASDGEGVSGDDGTWDKGGRIPGKGRKMIKALGGEHVMNPKASKMFRPMLDMMNEMGMKK